MLKLGNMVFLIEKIFLKICNKNVGSCTNQENQNFFYIIKEVLIGVKSKLKILIHATFSFNLHLIKKLNHLSIQRTIYPDFNKI